MGRQLAVQLTRHGCHLALSESVQNNKRRVLVGWDAIVLDKVQRLFPAAYAVIVGVILRRTYNR